MLPRNRVRTTCKGVGHAPMGPLFSNERECPGEARKSDDVLTSALPPTAEVLGRMSEAGVRAEVILDRRNFRV